MTLLLQIRSVQKVSPHPELHAKYLKTKKLTVKFMMTLLEEGNAIIILYLPHERITPQDCVQEMELG